jgi:hypothetical protein
VVEIVREMDAYAELAGRDLIEKSHGRDAITERRGR